MALTLPHEDARPVRRRAPGWDLEGEIQAIRTKGRYRRMRTITGGSASTVELGGREALLFCSNDYLGLAMDPEVIEASAEAARHHGAGSGSSRLISGTSRIHDALETRIASWKNTERALVFSTGYQANLGVLSTIVGRGDVILSDERNHASLIDGCRLSKAEVRIFPHADLDALARELREARGARRRLVVTDSVFSMDGDLAPLAAITELAETHGAEVMVDEAHATGVFGPTGAGLVEELGLRDRVLVQMGTLGKALGSFGAFVAGPEALVELLANRARTFVFTTGLPPSAAGAAAKAIEIVIRDPARRERLWRNARRLHEGLTAAGYRLGPLTSPILPVIVGADDLTMALSERLLDRGVFVQGIRPPTVAPGTSRLRLTAMATHDDDAIDRAIAAFVAVRGGAR